MHFHSEDRNDSRLEVRNGFWDEGWRGNICRRREDPHFADVIVCSNDGPENRMRRNLPVHESRVEREKKTERILTSVNKKKSGAHFG